MSDFDAIDALIRFEQSTVIFPWEGKGEDHALPEQAITRLYKSLKLNAPRFAWATSPAAMYTAINMLRHIQAGQRHKFIEGLVLADDPVASAKRAVLDAIIDRTITTTVGGSIKHMIPWTTWQGELWVQDIRRFLEHRNFADQMPIRTATTPSVNEVTVYPVEHHEGIIAIQPYVFSFVPYMHLCWMCLPPVEARLYPDQHLEYIRFADGYEIHLAPAFALKEGIDAQLPDALNPEVKGLSVEEYVDKKMSDGIRRLKGED